MNMLRWIGPLLRKGLAKRAETRPCPVCSELIPLRLMGKHLELESERVDEIIANVGSPEVYQDDREEG